MTPVQTQRQSVPSTVSAAADTDGAGPRVRDDMTVEVALSLMAGAGVQHLLLCDGDDQCTRSITWAELAVHRGSSRYTDRLRLRDVLAEPFASPVLRTVAGGGHGRGPGVLALSR